MAAVMPDRQASSAAAGLPTPSSGRRQLGLLASLEQELVSERGGVVAVDGAADELASLARHLERRARALACPALTVDGRVHDEPWLEAATRLGVDPVADATALARRLARGLGDGLLIVQESRGSRWGEAVAAELVQLSRGEALAATVIVLGAARVGAQPALSLPTPLGEQDIARYWEALVEDNRSAIARFDRLESLERWWGGARPEQRARAALLSREARRLFARLVLLRRSCPSSLVLALGSHGARDELVDARWLRVEADRAIVTQVPAREDDGEALVVAEALAEHGADPWAHLRAAELFAMSGARARACEQAMLALRQAPDAAARRDFWLRLDVVTDDADVDELTDYAELALELGDVEPALAMARRAAEHQRSADGFRLALALGRARRARGDATGASAALDQALELASDAGDEARARVELAELSLNLGEHDAARAHAEAAGQLADSCPATRLAARNVLGKVLIHRAEWSEAEQHFADDESEASCRRRESDALRARLNRAIAVLSMGRRGEARALFESVLEDGRRLGLRPACAFALANLSTFATLAHDYDSALDQLERAIDEVRALGDSGKLARLILNLADLRLRLGLVDEAEQALSFARHACGRGVLGEVAALLGFVTARVQLARGNTLAAAAELEDAIASATRSSNGAKLSECHRLATRVALEDGDVERARFHLSEAIAGPDGPYAQAELALLEAAVARAGGRAYAELAHKALSLAGAAADIELSRQARLLCAHAALADNDDDAAREHVDAARRLRDSVAATLPERLRLSFLGRREFAELDATLDMLMAAEQEPRRAQPKPRRALRRLVGSSAAMRSLRGAIEKIGGSDTTVLIAGESGTGKELVADALHAASDRAAGPCVKINCAALVETLLLSELFGHEKGAFTGAAGRKRGRFEQAHGGTLFLDEIGDISPKTQVALLRVLQERTIERVGGSGSIEVDVRVLCATHRDLREMVHEGRFREDLYYRLCGVTLPVPSLRDRLDDLPELADALLERIAGDQGGGHKRLGSDALDVLMRHAWPGNVRELENALRAAVLFADGGTIRAGDLLDNVEGLRHLAERPSIAPLRSDAAPLSSLTRLRHEPGEVVYDAVRGGLSLPEMKRNLERECIERALEEAEGNITHAAKLLGMKRPRLSQLVNQYAREDKQAQSEAEVSS